MRNNKIENCYKQILEGTNEAKAVLMEDVAEGLPFSEISEELESLASISGAVMSLAIGRGAESFPAEGRPGFVTISLSGKNFTSHESKVGAYAAFTTVKPNPVVSPKEIPATAEPIESKPTPAPVTETPVQMAQETKEIPIVEEAPATDDIPVVAEPATAVQSTTLIEESSNELEEDEMLLGALDAHYSLETKEDGFVKLPAEEPPIKEKASTESAIKVPNIIGDTTPEVRLMGKGDLFIEERSKAFEHMVFDTYKVGLSHVSSIKPEDMFFMIAPLEISKGDVAAAPILVYAFYKGQTFVTSSYDIKDESRNIVTMTIGDYEILARGSFKNGKFESMVVTTGISANQGDTLQIHNKDAHNPVGNNVKNGHVKFKYQSDEGPGTIDVFVLEPQGREFVIMNRYGDDWIDYYCINDRSGWNKALIYENGVKSEVICNWNGDILEADIVPA